MIELEELLEYAEQLRDDSNVKVSLYFVTRHLKPGMRVTAKVMDKFDFKLVKVPISPEISDFFSANSFQSNYLPWL